MDGLLGDTSGAGVVLVVVMVVVVVVVVVAAALDVVLSPIGALALELVGLDAGLVTMMVDGLGA